jgi:transcriptional regulator with XRE-family HTH domain
MSIGKNIKKFRELRNYTQAYMAESLGLSVSGYGKIERDETDVSITRLEEIARILDVNSGAIMNFDDKYILNLSNNHNANGIVNNQQIINNKELSLLVNNLIEDSKSMREFIQKMIEKFK